ncbi:helix-turn-helix transcriptional regulator [Algibacter mikhailovii]|nr:hypothetical protein [Algibacter mikhailovii]
MNTIRINNQKIVLLYLLNIMCFVSLHAQQFRTYSDERQFYSDSLDDSIYNTLQKTYQKGEAQRDIKSLVRLSAFERGQFEYGKAFSHAGEALFMAEEIQDSVLIAKAHEELGVLAYLYKQDEDAGSNFLKAHKYYKVLYKQSKIDIGDLYQSHYNLMMYYQRISNYDGLKAQIDSCRTLSTFRNEKFDKIFLAEKEASLFEMTNELAAAKTLLVWAASALENAGQNTDKAKFIKSFLIILYGRIGGVNIGLKRYVDAKQYFEKAVSIEDETGENIFYKSFVYSQYANLLYRQGEYKKAYESEQKAKFISDMYLNPRKDRNRGFLTVRNRYKDELAKKKELLNSKNLELANKEKDVLRFRNLLYVFLFVVVIFGFVVIFRIRSLKHQKKEKDSMALIDIKNKELTGSTLRLIEKEEIIKKLIDFIKSSNSEHQAKSLLKMIEGRSESLWDAFNTRFKEQNVGFYERLQQKIPDLSGADLKLCALIKLNFSGKEMAYLLGISLGSVHVARHRLRKKMDLNRGVNLTNLINSI